MAGQATVSFDREKSLLICEGEWELSRLAALQAALARITWPQQGKVLINGGEITKMDSAASWLLVKLTQQLETSGLQVQRHNFSEKAQKLFELVAQKMIPLSDLPPVKNQTWLMQLGKFTIQQLSEFRAYLNFAGLLSIETLRLLRQPSHFRFKPIISSVDKTGYQALAIIALLSFMIGVVIAYQMGFQLRNYGANVFIVDLLGLSVLREFGPLLTAIMVAGRTGSAFTAQLGIMKVNQEIDALSTMGITPGELLLLPRIIGLVIALPLLTMWADIFGILGGMLMANNMLSVTWVDFLQRFQREIPLRSLLIGLGKAPVFALVIASVGCFEGIQVQGSADSIGTKTTRSVVLGIFFIIVVDAIFSIIFSKLRL